MNHSLICVHCGTMVGVETRTDPVRTPLVTHLAALHGEMVGSGDLPRWAELLEHFRVVPRRLPSGPRVVQA
jgi:hypothetical protein